MNFFSKIVVGFGYYLVRKEKPDSTWTIQNGPNENR